MSTAARPSRRLPAQVYWVRRVMLLLLVLLLAFAVARFFGNDAGLESGPPPTGNTGNTGNHGNNGKDGTAAGAGVGASVSAVAAPPLATPTSRRSSDLSRVRPELGSPAGACDPADITVVPSADGRVESGSGAPIQLRLTVIGEQACRLSLDDRLLVQVARDGAALWSLTDCPSALGVDTAVLHPGWATVVQLEWSGRTSNPTCALETPAVQPGTYQLQAALLQGEPATVRLDVAAAPDAATGRDARGGRSAGGQT